MQLSTKNITTRQYALERCIRASDWFSRTSSRTCLNYEEHLFVWNQPRTTYVESYGSLSTKGCWLISLRSDRSRFWSSRWHLLPPLLGFHYSHWHPGNKLIVDCFLLPNTCQKNLNCLPLQLKLGPESLNNRGEEYRYLFFPLFCWSDFFLGGFDYII